MPARTGSVSPSCSYRWSALILVGKAESQVLANSQRRELEQDLVRQICGLADIWVWVKIKPPGIGPQVLVRVSIYQGFILGTYF